MYVTHDQTEAMTLGDRVVVMRDGVAQQIGTPEELYHQPANLFVAGFIGSPAMNFFPATLTDVGVRLPFGEVTLTQEVHELVARVPEPTNVIVGIRPEHLEDAALIDTYARIRALTFDATVDLVESLGADKIRALPHRGRRCPVSPAGRVGGRIGAGENEFVARVSDGIHGAAGPDDGARFRHRQTGGLRRRHRRQPDLAARHVTDVVAAVRAHLLEHFARLGITAEPDTASITFLGSETIDVLRFGPTAAGVAHYVSLGCSRHPMADPTELVTDALHGPRAEVAVALRGPTPAGLARSLAVLAAAPAVEGLILESDALIDLQTPLFDRASFTAFLLGPGDIEPIDLPDPLPAVTVLAATPITATEAAWVRLKGADAMREAWRQDGVDVLDPGRPGAQPG